MGTATQDNSACPGPGHHQHATPPGHRPRTSAPRAAILLPPHFLADPVHASSDSAWEELPDRHMHWAPVYRHEANAWVPEWVCLRCNATIDETHPMLNQLPQQPVCATHGPRRLAIDLREGSCGWVCCQGSPPQILDCPRERLPAPALDSPRRPLRQRSTTSKQGGVNCDLGTPPQRQAIGDHLNAPVILTDGVKIEISDEDVEGNRRPCFSADPGGRSLQRASTCAQVA